MTPLTIYAQTRVEPVLLLVCVPGRVLDEPRLPKSFVNRIVHVSVDPERGLIPLDHPVQVRCECRVEWIALVPVPD